MKKFTFACMAFILVILSLSKVVLGVQWDWVEAFDTGMDGWIPQATDSSGHESSGAWSWQRGKIVCTDLPSSGYRGIRYPLQMSTANGFVMEAKVNISNMASPITHVGLMFGASADMNNSWQFSIKKGPPKQKNVQWSLNHQIPGSNYSYGFSYASYTNELSQVLRVEYDGHEMRGYVDGKLVICTRRWHNDDHIPDGYVGIQVWDADKTGTIEVSEVRFATIRKPFAFSPITSIQAKQEDAPVPEVNWTVPDIGMEFVWNGLSRCWVGRYEVTNAEFRHFRPNHNSDTCAGANGRTFADDYKGKTVNGDRHPVVSVSYNDGEAFAKWLTDREKRAGRLPENFQYRLPTDREWNTFSFDPRTFIWGNKWPPPYGNYVDSPDYQDGFEVTCPVEQSERNGWDLYGVGGNAWEWTLGDTGKSVAKGGSWGSSEKDLHYSEWIKSRDTTYQDYYTGFRLVLAPAQSALPPAASGQPLPSPGLPPDLNLPAIPPSLEPSWNIPRQRSAQDNSGRDPSEAAASEARRPGIDPPNDHCYATLKGDGAFSNIESIAPVNFKLGGIYALCSNSTVNISDCRLQDTSGAGLYIKGDKNLVNIVQTRLTGNACFDLNVVSKESVANLISGEIGRIRVEGASTVNVLGGLITQKIVAVRSGIINVYGSKLEIKDDHLIGILADGTPIHVEVEKDVDAKVVLLDPATVPLPANLTGLEMTKLSPKVRQILSLNLALIKLRTEGREQQAAELAKKLKEMSPQLTKKVEVSPANKRREMTDEPSIESIPIPHRKDKPLIPLGVLHVKKVAPTGRVRRVPDELPDIQKAINASAAGDIVLLEPGNYLGDIQLSPGVTVVGRKPYTVVLKGNVKFADRSRLINLTFRDASIGPVVQMRDRGRTEIDALKRGTKGNHSGRRADMEEFRRMVKGNISRDIPQDLRSDLPKGFADEDESDMDNTEMAEREQAASPTVEESAEPQVRDVSILFCDFGGKKIESVMHAMESMAKHPDRKGITDLRRLDQEAEAMYALLRMDRVEDLQIAGCVFSGGEKEGDLYGVHLRNCRNLVFMGNTVTDLGESGYGNTAGVTLEYCSGEVTSNLIANLSEKMWGSAYGIWAKMPRGLKVRHNTIVNLFSDEWDSTYGIAANGRGKVEVTANLIDRLQGEGWTSPIYGIWVDTNDATVTQNNVGQMENIKDEGKLPQAYVGTSGSPNWEVLPVLSNKTLHVTGPSELMAGDKPRVGIGSGSVVEVFIPDLDVELPILSELSDRP